MLGSVVIFPPARRVAALANYLAIIQVASLVGFAKGTFGRVSGTWSTARAPSNGSDAAIRRSAFGSAVRRLRRTAAPAIKTVAHRVGVCGALRRWRPGRDVAILRYHAICAPEGHAYADPHLCVSPESFERHVAYLAANYRVLPLPEIVARLRERRSLPANTVAFTFDDGYADNLEAARTLSRYGVSGTFYLTAGCLAGGQPFWPSEIRYLLRAIPDSTLTLRVPGQRLDMPYASPCDRRTALARITHLLKCHPIAVRDQLREQLRRLAQHVEVPAIMLTWEAVAEMQRLGMTIGAHTVTHPNLPSAGLSDATQEIKGSKRMLEHHVGRDVTMFSYPNGGAESYYTPELQRAVARAGFLAATTSHNGFTTAASDLYALERVKVAERLEDLIFALEVERFAFAPR